ncbi:hypothetical protein [Streptomyces fradiae]|uniref:hypothetical protein n=1 Tax=Streptomyces fradiae TaxID=1906 RepID=UPI0036676B8C
MIAFSIVLAAVGGVFGYSEIFTKGIDRLPDRPCGGAVARDLVTQALPSSRTAEERGRMVPTSKDLAFYCSVSTDDSTLSGEVRGTDSSVGTWRDHFAGPLAGTSVEVVAADVRAISTPKLATVYVPCTLPQHKKGSAAEAYSLTAEARTIGPTRAKGDELRQVVADFAYQLLRHAYEAGGCKEARDFPDALPRLTEGRVVEEPVG